MFTLQVRKLFRKTLLFSSTTPQRPTRLPTRPELEVLEDRSLPSAPSLPVLPSEAVSPLAVASSSLFAFAEQRVQQFAAIVQYASKVVNSLDWEMLEEVAALQLQVARFFGIDSNSPNPSQGATAIQPGSSATTNHHPANPSTTDAMPSSDSAGGG